MGAVDDPTVVGRLGVGLSAQLKAEILDQVGRGAAKRLSDGVEVHDNGFDTVAFALNLGLQPLHLVAVERIGNIATDIDGSHGDWISQNQGGGQMEGN